MLRCSARTSNAGAEALVKGIVMIVALFALAVGGITHAAEAFVSLVVLGLVVLVVAGWPAPRMEGRVAEADDERGHHPLRRGGCFLLALLLPSAAR